MGEVGQWVGLLATEMTFIPRVDPVKGENQSLLCDPPNSTWHDVA